MRNVSITTLVRYLERHWVWLLVNGVIWGLAIRVGWMIVDAPYSKGWILFSTVESSQNIVLFTGQTALVLLILSLACTPVATLTGWRKIIQVRKSLGLWGFAFGLFHGLYFLNGKSLMVDGDQIALLRGSIADMVNLVRYQSKAPYAEAGVYALVLLVPLALTSNRWAMRLLGKNWKRLHRLVYLLVPVALWHYWWREMGTKWPDYTRPLLFTTLVALLLIARIPLLRRRLQSVSTWFRPKALNVQ